MKSIIRLFTVVAFSMALFCLGDAVLADALGKESAQTAAAVLFENGSEAISLSKGAVHDNLTIYPLVTSKPTKDNPYLPLDKAMDRGKLRVKERGSGTVPTLSVKNTGKDKVFVMTGEIVTGAKQDRMSAHDVLLPPNQKQVKLPVYCVEQGRWNFNSRQFSAGKTAGTTMLRKSAAKKAGQGRIWSKVAKKSGAASVSSSTGTMQAVYSNRNVKQRIAKYEKALGSMTKGRDDIVGFVAAVDGNIISADLFANHALMQALWNKLLKAAAIDAITSEAPPTEAPTAEEVQAFVKTGFNGARKKAENPGLGKEFLIEAENDISGTVLVHDERIVHLSVFGPDREDRPRQLEQTAISVDMGQNVSTSDSYLSQQAGNRSSLEKNNWEPAEPDFGDKKGKTGPSSTKPKSKPSYKSKKNTPSHQTNNSAKSPLL